jgi:hypothetical protein
MKNPYSRTRLTVYLAAAGLAIAPAAFAVDPPPDGGYPKRNTAEGQDALLRLRKGADNTAIGFEALVNHTNGDSNTAVGSGALHSQEEAVSNTAVGYDALFTNVTGIQNLAIGDHALFSNISGGANIALGNYTLYYNTSGGPNIAIGGFTLYNNTEGFYNIAIGDNSLHQNSTGQHNIATGSLALNDNSTGNDNCAFGFTALENSSTGSNNIAIGSAAGFRLITGSNNIDIGNRGDTHNESGTVRIGTDGTQTNTYIAGISGVTVAGGVGVVIDTTGHLGTVTSSARCKDNIQPMEKASETVLSLKPVTFHYKKELDPKAIPQFGLVAEDVAKIDPDLVARDNEGKPYTVRYEAVNAMLLNEFLKEHRKVEEQDATIAQLKSVATEQQKEMKELRTSLKEQAAQIQKVSARLEADKATPRIVADDH